MTTTRSLLLAAISLIAALSFAATPAVTPAAAPPRAPVIEQVSPYSLSANVNWVSAYMFRGQRLAESSIQPNVEATIRDLTLGVWSSVPATRRALKDESAEVDLYASGSVNLSDRLVLIPGFTYYTYPRAITHAGAYRSTFEPSLGLTATILGVKITPKAFYDTVLRGATWEVSGAYSLPLKAIRSSLDFSAVTGSYRLLDASSIGKVSSKAWGDYWSAGVSAPITVTKHTKLTLGWTYAVGRDAFGKVGSARQQPNDLAVGRGVTSIGYGYSF